MMTKAYQTTSDTPLCTQAKYAEKQNQSTTTSVVDWHNLGPDYLIHRMSLQRFETTMCTDTCECR